MDNLSSIQSWAKNTWENSKANDPTLQKQANSDIQELNASERKLLIDIINGNYQNGNDQAVVNLDTKLQAMGKPDYQATRSTWFWSDVSRSAKNFTGRTSSTIALKALNTFYTEEASREAAKKEKDKKTKQLMKNVKNFDTKSQDAPTKLSAFTKESIELNLYNTQFDSLMTTKYIEVYGNREGQARYEDDCNRYNFFLKYGNKATYQSPWEGKPIQSQKPLA